MVKRKSRPQTFMAVKTVVVRKSLGVIPLQVRVLLDAQKVVDRVEEEVIPRRKQDGNQ